MPMTHADWIAQYEALEAKIEKRITRRHELLEADEAQLASVRERLEHHRTQAHAVPDTTGGEK